MTRGKLPSGIKQDENRKKIYQLEQRLKEKKKTIFDVFDILGPHSPYYVLSLTMNALIFAVYNHLNEMDQYLIYSEDEHTYTNERGKIVNPEHPTVIDENGNYETSNGAMDLSILTILNNVSSMFGCIVAILIARWSMHKSVITFTILVVASFLLSQAFLFNFFDRIAFVVGTVLSKCLSIITIQAAFESGIGKYRIWAVGVCYYLSYSFVFVTILLFKKDSDYAETHFMFIVTAFGAIYALMAPWQIIHSIVRRDTSKIQTIIDKFGISENVQCNALVDDVLYVSQVPRSAIESMGHLIKIKPFMKKLIALTCLIAIQSRLNSGEMEIIKTMLPYSPMESILFSRIAACFASLFSIFCVSKFGRRPFLLTLLTFNLLISYSVSLIPIESFSVCFSKDMPNEEHDVNLKFSFIALTMIRVCSSITIILITLEHIPTLHRSFVFPIVMFCDAIMSSISDAAPYLETELYDTPLFIRPMVRYSIISLIMTALFIDNSDVSVFSTDEIRCYNLKNAKLKKMGTETKNDFEEKFRVLCEVKAVERETQGKQQVLNNEVHYNEVQRYYRQKRNKLEMKQKLKDTRIDKETREEFRKQYLKQKEINKKCIEASQEKLKMHDQETQNIVHEIQKNRLKD